MVNQIPDEGICPEKHRDEGSLFALDDRPAPTWPGRFRPCRKEFLFYSPLATRRSPLATYYSLLARDSHLIRTISW
jgi:hypothetical protein